MQSKEWPAELRDRIVLRQIWGRLLSCASSLEEASFGGDSHADQFNAVCGVWSEHWQADPPPLQTLQQCWQHSYIQGWIGNRHTLSRWADALKGPTECFFFFCHQQGQRAASAQWFVSCIDSINHQLQSAIHGPMKYFAPPIYPNFFLVAFPTFSQQF